MLRETSRLLPLTLALLGVSVVGNVVLMMSSRGAPPTPAVESARATSPAPLPEDGRSADCERELASCRKTASGLLVGLWSAPREPTMPSPPPVPPDSGAPPPPAPPASSPADALCRVARAKMLVGWAEKRDDVQRFLFAGFSDPERAKAAADLDAQQAAQEVGGDDDVKRGQFQSDFADLRRDEMKTVADAASQNPMDWASLLPQVEDMFQKENQLADRDLGADAVSRLKEGELERRVTVLTMLATYAGEDWDQALQSL